MELSPVEHTLKRAKLLFWIIAVMGTMFSFWGLKFFILNEPTDNVGTTPYILFPIMAMLSFLYGFRFAKNYAKVRRAEILKHGVDKRKEAMIVATAIQLLLIEFIVIIGLFLAIFVQKREIVYPFFALFVVGLYFSFPKADWYKDVLES